MKAARLLCSLALLVGFFGIAHAQNGCVRLSWGTCDPLVEDRYYSGPTVYTLVESVFGVSAANLGTDTWIRIFRLYEPGGMIGLLPDAWRFDDAGCQPGGQLAISSNPFNKSCPAMKGANPSSAATYVINSDNTAYLRLMSSYDSFTPLPTTRYTVLQVIFDHTYSSPGPTPPDHSTCGGVDGCVNFLVERSDLIIASDQRLPLAPCDQNPFKCWSVSWNGGCESPDQAGCTDPPVPSQLGTWGRVKSLYR